MWRDKQPAEYSERGQPIELDDVHAHSGQQKVETLMKSGFGWEEAVKLARMHEHIYENVEVKQRVAEDAFMQFARWLYEQGEITDTVE